MTWPIGGRFVVPFGGERGRKMRRRGRGRLVALVAIERVISNVFMNGLARHARRLGVSPHSRGSVCTGRCRRSRKHIGCTRLGPGSRPNRPSTGQGTGGGHWRRVDVFRSLAPAAATKPNKVVSHGGASYHPVTTILICPIPLRKLVHHRAFSTFITDGLFHH